MKFIYSTLHIILYRAVELMGRESEKRVNFQTSETRASSLL